MTTKEILDKQQFYNKDELKKLKRDELVEIMVKYSLKHSGIRKDMLIFAIIQHQEHLIDLKSKTTDGCSLLLAFPKRYSS
ncbi:hypothetical protein PPL_01918 [Heterostelium album PN500]|uniref:Uncharacterized protein n=1 Tax=Heterostelium pallidum (strain ATCC 26659 / Pp 5 / PN500) TaxID=670386 RepID=D3B0V1_HETP5|nr:hypothetical protein PPL_01918 [Heterostelium album PN500]EFA84925.1 hypothetical protein PPL_01918 [Heterostelium album PN500]|eukprot:XP_020437035.1 hypothetical protein PPL_01918 [Heterostelium album PN500]